LLLLLLFLLFLFLLFVVVVVVVVVAVSISSDWLECGLVAAAVCNVDYGPTLTGRPEDVLNGYNST
jgi:hypothetical protein